MFQKNLSRVVLFSLLIQLFLPYQLSLSLVGGFPSLQLETLSTEAAGPGGTGTGNLRLWLKADAGITANGSNQVTQWVDQSPNAIHVNQGTLVNTADLQANTMNFNPSLGFDNEGWPNADYYNITSNITAYDGTNNHSVVYVIKDDNTKGTILGQGNVDGAFGADFDGAKQRAIQSNLGTAAVATNSFDNNKANILYQDRNAGTFNFFTNGAANGSVASGQSFSASSVDFLGLDVRNTSGNHDVFTGNMAEVIVYNSALSPTERNKLNSYLALKYGVTLNSVIGNYLNSAGNSVYNLVTFSNDVVGLGYDSASGLDQRVSQGVNDTDGLILATDNDFSSANGGSRTQLADGQYLVVGHNGSTKNSFTRTFDGQANMLSDRMWKIENTGNVSSVHIAVPLGQISNIPSGGTPAFIVSVNPTFDYNDSIFPMTYDQVNGRYYAEITTLTDGAYISIAPVPVATASAYYRTTSVTNTVGVTAFPTYADFIGNTNGVYTAFSIPWSFADSFFVDGAYFYRTNSTQTNVTRYPSVQDLGAGTNGITYNFTSGGNPMDWADTDEFFSSATEYYRTNSNGTGTPSLTSYPSFADLVANTNSTTSNTFNSTYAFEDQFFHDGTYFMRTGTSGGNHVNVARYASLADLENGVLVGGATDSFGPWSTNDDIFAQAVTAEITVSTGSLSVSENSGTGSFTVVLNARPASNVVVDITSSDIAEATVSPASLTFTPSNWSVAQSVTVTGVDDSDLGDDTATVTITVNDASSNDAFDAVVDKTVDVTLINEDVFTPNSPTDFATLTLWLDANDIDGDGTAEGTGEAGLTGSEVDRWEDKSGQNNDAVSTGGKPQLDQTLNGLQTLAFNSDRIATTDSDQITANGAYTQFVVFSVDNQLATNNILSSDNNASKALFTHSDGQGVRSWHVANGGTATGHVQSGPITNNQFYIVGNRYGAGGALPSVLNLNGTQLDSDTGTYAHAASTMAIGSFSSGTNPLNGDVAELLIYNSALSNEQIDCIEAYLGDKWGITTSNAGSSCAIPTSITLTKTNYPQYKVFQRDSSDQYDFALSGTYNGACTGVEASFDGGAYTSIATSLTGGTWSGTLSDQAVGQGRLSVRCTNNTSIEDGVDNIGVGDIYVVAGQSNAVGHVLAQQNYTLVAPTATVEPATFHAGAWRDLKSGSIGSSGRWSVWPLVGGYIAENTGIPVAFIPTAVNGSAQSTWVLGQGNYTNMVSTVTNANVNGVKAVLWFQGETDATNLTSRALYNSRLDDFATNVRNDLPGTPDVVPGTIGHWPNSPDQVRLAIIDAWDDNPNILYGPNTYDINLQDAGDGIHFQTNEDAQQLGYRWWKALQNHYYGGTDGRGPVLQSAELGVGNTTIEVTFTDTTLPLLSSGALSTQVWSVNNNGSVLGVTGASITGTGTVTLTLASAASSTGVTLSYASFNTGENQNVLTDSSTGNTALGTSPLPADPFSNFPVSQNTAAAIIYTGDTFVENTNNNGTLPNSLTITLQNDTFVDPITLDTHLTVTGYTPGLTPVVTRNSSTELSLSFSGTADVHLNSDDVSDVTLTFLDGAFVTNTTASSVTGFTKNDIALDYRDLPIVSPTTTGMTLWLDANDVDGDGTAEGASESGLVSGDVATWADKSGQNNSVTGTARPTLVTNGLNGKAVLDFTTDSLVAPDTDQITANTSYTKFVVFKKDTANVNMNLISSSIGTALAFWLPNTNKLANWHLNGSTSPGHNVSTTTIGTTDYYIGATRYGNPNGLSNILNLNGTEESTDSTTQTFPAHAVQIGAHQGGTNLDGKIAEAIVYDRALSDSEIDEVECYLSQKWGIAVSHTCNTPTLTTPKIVINEVEYDSIQSGTDSAYEWIELKNTGTGNLDLQNWTLGDDDGGGTFTFPQHSIIYAGQTLLVANDTASFQTNYSSVTPDIDTGNIFNLANTGEPITLANASGATIDFMAFEGGDIAWTTLSANPGETVCRKDGADTDTVADWQVCQIASPDAENIFNQIPTNITLSGSGTVVENTATGTIVGTLTTTDEDVTDTHTYSFATGTGDTDNSSFTLSGTVLATNFSPDFETKNSYSVRIETDDGNGGTFQKEFTITIIDLDEIAPLITLTGSGTVNILKNTSYTDAGATWTDNVDGSGSLVSSGSVDTSTTGTYTLTYDYTDTAGNTATQVSRTVNVITGDIPVITLTGSGTVNILKNTSYTDAGATASDTEDGVLTSSITSSGTVDTNTLGTYTITYDVTDTQDNDAVQVIRTVHVVTGDIPVITLVGSGTLDVEYGSSYSDAGATASDTEDGILTSSVTSSGSVDTNTLGTYTITYDVTDTQDNDAAQVTRTINVVDTTLPVITLTGTATITLEVGDNYTDAGATWTDNVDGSGSLVASGSVNTSGTGTFILTYDYTDTAGNPATQVTRTVNVVDTTLPVITLTGSGTVEVVKNASYTDAGATASDNLDGNISSSITSSGTVDTNTLGTYTITYDVTDASGNTATQVSRTVNVVAGDIPVITLNGSGTIDIEFGSTYTDAGATASDTEDGVLTSSITSSGTVDTNTLGTYTITYNVTDSSDNDASQISRTVNVVDTTIPVITLTGSGTVNILKNTTYTDSGATWTDNVDGSGSLVASGSVDTSTIGSYTLTYNYTDSSGNAATQVIRTVNVISGNIPVITLVGSGTVIHPQGTPYTDAGATASDTEDGDISSSITLSGSVNTTATGSYTLSYNVTDSSGNAATQVSRTVQVLSQTVDSDNDGTPDYQEGLDGTDPSDETSIQDTDGDGVGDYEEGQGFNSGDGDGDGIPDATQQNVSGAQNPVTGQTSTLKTSGTCTFITENEFIAESSLIAQDPNADYPVGLVDFRVQCINPGDSSDVTIYYTELYDTSNWRYKKYDGAGNVYADITGLVTFGTATVGGTQVTTVSFTVTDGDPQTDEDGIADGIINDPSGPAVIVSSGSGGGSSGSIKKMDVCNDNGGDFSGNYYDGLCTQDEIALSAITPDHIDSILSEEEKTFIEETNTEGDQIIHSLGEDTIEKETSTGQKYTFSHDFSSCLVVTDIKDIDFVYNEGGVFVDEGTMFYRDEILKFAQIGVVNGYEDSTFQPKKEISRTEFLKVILKSHCYEYQNQVTENLIYADVDITSWQARVIGKAQELGLINGDRDENGVSIFRPDDIISKGEAIKIAMKMSMIQASNPVELGYRDITTDWHIPYIRTGETLGLFNAEIDNSLFSPESGVTRESMIDIIYRLIQLY